MRKRCPARCSVYRKTLHSDTGKSHSPSGNLSKEKHQRIDNFSACCIFTIPAQVSHPTQQESSEVASRRCHLTLVHGAQHDRRELPCDSTYYEEKTPKRFMYVGSSADAGQGSITMSSTSLVVGFSPSSAITRSVRSCPTVFIDVVDDLRRICSVSCQLEATSTQAPSSQCIWACSLATQS